MGFTTTSAPRKAHLTPTTPREKTASGDFFVNANKSRRKNPRQPLKTQQENRPSPSKTVSGVEETGLYYYGYRYYDPVTGRWPSRDPLGENWSSGEFNEYSFVNNDGVNSGDYLGLSTMTWGQYVALPIAANAARGGSRGGPWLAVAGAVIGAGIAADAILEEVSEANRRVEEAKKALDKAKRRTCEIISEKKAAAKTAQSTGSKMSRLKTLFKKNRFCAADCDQVRAKLKAAKENLRLRDLWDTNDCDKVLGGSRDHAGAKKQVQDNISALENLLKKCIEKGL